MRRFRQFAFWGLCRSFLTALAYAKDGNEGRVMINREAIGTTK